MLFSLQCLMDRMRQILFIISFSSLAQLVAACFETVPPEPVLKCIDSDDDQRAAALDGGM